MFIGDYCFPKIQSSLGQSIFKYSTLLVFIIYRNILLECYINQKYQKNNLHLLKKLNNYKINF